MSETVVGKIAQLTNTRNWAQYYIEKRPDYNIYQTSPIIQGLIRKLMPMGESLIEWGYGTGFTAIALANLKKRVFAYDPEIELLAPAIAARRENLNSLIGRAGFTCDLQMLTPADIVYSQGLLEHFTDGEIKRSIDDQLIYAKRAVVFSVPSINYPQQDFGNERLMTLSEWERILSPFADKLSQLYYYERDQHIIGVIRNG